MTEEVTTTQHDGWLEVSLNRPEQRNAITGPLGEALANALAQSHASDCNVVLLRGAGGAFCSGLDLKAFNAEPPPRWMGEFAAIWRRAHAALYDCPVPIVVALERYAINGGAALALAGDLLVAGQGAFIQVGEVQQGMAAPYNMAWLGLRTSEHVRAQLAMVGRRFSGPELQSLGLAYSVVEDEGVLEAARDLCKQLAGYPPGATAKIKQGMRPRGVSADAWFDQYTAVDPVGRRLQPKAVQ